MSLNQKLTVNRNYNRYYNRFKLWSRQPQVRISGLASLTIFTVAFFLIVAILPTFRTIATLKKEISDQKTVEAKLGAKIISLQAAEPNFKTIVETLPAIKQFLPESESFDRLSWQLHWLAQQTGVEISAGNFGEFDLLNPTAGIQGLPNQLIIDLTISGNYRQIKNFLDRITGMDRLLTVMELTITNKNSKIASKLTATMKLGGFYLPLTGGQP